MSHRKIFRFFIYCNQLRRGNFRHSEGSVGEGLIIHLPSPYIHDTDFTSFLVYTDIFADIKYVRKKTVWNFKNYLLIQIPWHTQMWNKAHFFLQEVLVCIISPSKKCHLSVKIRNLTRWGIRQACSSSIQKAWYICCRSQGDGGRS